jgi:ATP-dependent Clp protease ATP-binding subunit ClpA/ATP-dependent Clp protease ATP-binding subunit ClpC
LQARRQVVLRLVGPAVRSFFEGEAGTHVRQSLAGGTEIVRVRVRDGDIAPDIHVRSLARAREAFVAALESGQPLPDNPDVVLPIVRRYRFDPSAPPVPGARISAGELTPIEVEDYPLAHVSQTRVRTLKDVLPRLWWLRVGLDVDFEDAVGSQEV